MQLNLFEDNKPGILLNIADEFILSRDFDQAISVYEQLREEYPGDRQSANLLELVSQWRQAVSTMNLSNPESFADIWGCFGAISHAPLKSVVLRLLIDELWTLPDAERIYCPPACHFGHLLMEGGRFSEAADCFYRALSAPHIPRGRFLAWRGDALTLADNESAALKSYLDAFLEDPATVDMRSIACGTIRDLYSSLCEEATEEIEADGEAAWLPVWGWFEEVFALPLLLERDREVAHDSAAFEDQLEERMRTVPRIWFDMLASAERLRATARDNREMAAIRRLMKKNSSFMFDKYFTVMSERR